MLNFPTRFDPAKTGYGYLQYDATNNVYHPGIDFNFGAPNEDLGQPVVCPAHGTILYISTDGANGGLGKYVVIEHHRLAVFTRYCHLQSVQGENGKTLKVGDKISMGEHFARVGGTGGFAPHLHFEVLKYSGMNFIKNHWRQPYNGYFQGVSRAAVASMTIDPIAWIENSNNVLDEQPIVGAEDWREEVKVWAQHNGIIVGGWDNPTQPMSQERVAAALKKMYEKLYSELKQ